MVAHILAIGLPLLLLGVLLWLLVTVSRSTKTTGSGCRRPIFITVRRQAIILFLLFLFFVFLEIIESAVGLRYGGREVGVLFWLVGDFQAMAFIKGVFSFLLGMVLVAYNQVGLLKLANVLMLAVVAYHGVMLWQTFSP